MGGRRRKKSERKTYVTVQRQSFNIKDLKLVPLNTWDEEIQFFNIEDLKQNVVCDPSEEEFEDTLPPQGEISQLDGLRNLSISYTKGEDQVEQIRRMKTKNMKIVIKFQDNSANM
ncbi:hypothetical protein AMTR_s00007p00268180 [Amborella trichopoda]|uniref:Uncharacterized protein n=1 Tax=Amborella trichopoda TaxID=13333 RepID=W1PC98_AMBTC|nr:hypothetical protein AMTR_s00007p00268180 [Amborella trichopoda]